MDNAIVGGVRKRPSADEIAAKNAEETGRKIREIFARSKAARRLSQAGGCIG
jgi:hypothetical protein